MSIKPSLITKSTITCPTDAKTIADLGILIFPIKLPRESMLKVAFGKPLENKFQSEIPRSPNIEGAVNVIDAAIDKKVEKVVALSTDKAVNPISLYGGTKLVSDKLFVSANSYTGKGKTSFTVVRYGNVAGSRGSVIPLFTHLLNGKNTTLPITDFRMSRFWLSLDQAVNLVFNAINNGQGGEIYVAKCPSFKVVDLAKAMNPKIELKEIGIRPGEKLHEIMVTEEDAPFTYEHKEHFLIDSLFSTGKRSKSRFRGYKKVKSGFHYSSDANSRWFSQSEISKILPQIEIDSHNSI